MAGCTPLTGAMNSSAWLVELAETGRRCVAKAVPAPVRRHFEAGLAVAERLATHGTASGRPIRTADDEVEATLPTLLRFRGAVQADYFAYRIWVDDRTGIGEPAENHVGLQHARTMLETA